METPVTFPERIPEPFEMETLEMEVFRQISDDSLAYWIPPIIDELEFFTGHGHRNVLDAACGPGHLTAALAETFTNATIWALDVSGAAVRMTKERCRSLSNVEPLICTVERIPFSDKTFDLVVCKDSMHHFADPRVALREMARVTRPSGWVYAQDMRRDMPWDILRMAVPPDTPVKQLQYYSTRAAYTASEIVALLMDLPEAMAPLVQVRRLDDAMRHRYRHLDPVRLEISLRSRWRAIFRKW